MKKKKKKINLNSHFYKCDLFHITISFRKRTAVLTTGYTYFDTTTNKIEVVKFYNYYDRLKNFGFKRESKTVRYEKTLSVDQKQTEKKIWCKHDKNALLVDETTVMLEADGKTNGMGEHYIQIQQMQKR